MGPIEMIEKFINEHGSAAILREHLGLLKAEQSAFERKAKDLQLENDQLKFEISQLLEKVRSLEGQLHPSGYCCDHCGSSRLKRTGNRPDPTFGELGIKLRPMICFFVIFNQEDLWSVTSI